MISGAGFWAHDVALVVLHGVAARSSEISTSWIFSRGDSDDLVLALGGNGPGEIRDRHGGDLGDEDSPPLAISSTFRTKCTPWSSVIQKRVMRGR